MGVNTLASIGIARNGGPPGYAVFAANMLVFVATTLCTFGLPIALAKHVAAEEERTGTKHCVMFAQRLSVRCFCWRSWRAFR
jgi:O-antigen/teichoic acid export membrane protein